MLNYENKFDRPARIANLPQNLKPEEIVDCIASYEQATPIIDLLNRAIPDFMASQEFCDFDPDHRKEVAMTFRFLMDTMLRIQEFERRTFVMSTDFWEPVQN